MKWLADISEDDIPVEINPEIGGAGDDVEVVLATGRRIQAQCKRTLANDVKFKATLRKMIAEVKAGSEDYYVLVAGPSTGKLMRDKFKHELRTRATYREPDTPSAPFRFFRKEVGDIEAEPAIAQRILIQEQGFERSQDGYRLATALLRHVVLPIEGKSMGAFEVLVDFAGEACHGRIGISRQNLHGRLSDEGFTIIEMGIPLAVRAASPASPHKVVSAATIESVTGTAVLTAMRALESHRAGDAEEASRLALQSEEEYLKEEHSEEVLRKVALALHLAGHCARAFPLWQRLVPEPIASEDARCMVAAAQALDDHAFVVAYFKSLRAAEIYDHDFLEPEFNYLLAASAFDDALDLVSKVESAGRMESRDAAMYRDFVNLAAGRLDEVRGDPSLIRTASEVEDLQHGLEVLEILRCGQHPEAAVRFGYELYSRYPNEMNAQWGYIKSVVAPVGRLESEAPSVVGAATAVHLVSVAGKQRTVFVRSDVMDQVPADHFVEEALLGKKVGDSVVLDFGGEVEEWRIHLILGDMNELAYNLFVRFETAFPGNPYVRRVPAFSADGTALSEELQNMVRTSDAKRGAILEGVRDGQLAIATASVVTGASTLDVMIALLSRGWEIPCCFGNPNEWTSAVSALLSADSVVCDPTALATLAMLSGRSWLGSIFPRLVFPESELSSWTHQNLPIKGEHASLFMTSVDDQVGPIKHDQADVDAYHLSISELAKELRAHSQAVDGSHLLAFNAAFREQLLMVFGKPTAEAIAAAKAMKLPLWTDDIRVSSLAVTMGIQTVWTQAVASWAVNQHGAQMEDYRELSVWLLRARYEFTRIDTAIAERAIADPGGVSAVQRHLGNNDVTAQSVVRIAAELIAKMWKESMISPVERTTEIAAGIARRADVGSSGRALLGHVGSLLRLMPLQQARALEVIHATLDAVTAGVDTPAKPVIWRPPGT